MYADNVTSTVGEFSSFGKLIDFAHSVRCSRNSLKVNGAGAGNRTRMSVGSGDFKPAREG